MQISDFENISKKYVTNWLTKCWSNNLKLWESSGICMYIILPEYSIFMMIYSWWFDSESESGRNGTPSIYFFFNTQVHTLFDIFFLTQLDFFTIDSFTINNICLLKKYLVFFFFFFCLKKYQKRGDTWILLMFL